MTTHYGVERRAFDRLRLDCSGESRGEYEQAIAILTQRYNTTIYENRFTVGGAVEVFTYALLKTVGIDCTLYGDQAAGGDILLPGDSEAVSKKSIYAHRCHHLGEQAREGCSGVANGNTVCARWIRDCVRRP